MSEATTSYKVTTTQSGTEPQERTFKTEREADDFVFSLHPLTSARLTVTRTHEGSK